MRKNLEGKGLVYVSINPFPPIGLFPLYSRFAVLTEIEATVYTCLVDI